MSWLAHFLKNNVPRSVSKLCYFLSGNFTHDFTVNCSGRGKTQCQGTQEGSCRQHGLHSAQKGRSIRQQGQ